MKAFALLALVMLAAIGVVVTRDFGQSDDSTTGRPRKPSLVDEKPLQSARALAALASDRTEQQSAQQAVKLADHEVDLAFADALRDATEHRAAPSPEIKEMTERETVADAAVKAGQARIEQLKKQVAAASGKKHDDLQQSLDTVTAQLELDQDELDDVKENLLRSGSDPLSRIQRQFNRHEAAEKALEQSGTQTVTVNPDTNYQSHNLWAQFSAWRALRKKGTLLEAALKEAEDNAAALAQKHNELVKRVQEEKSSQPSISNSAKAASTTASAEKIASLHHLSVDQKDLADLNKRIQDFQEISTAYTNWNDRVETHTSDALHGILISVILIMLVFLGVHFTGQLVDHIFVEEGVERARQLTIHVVSQFTVRIFGIALLLFVVFGAPSQVPALVGLAGLGAGFTVALKDFFGAFFGWIVLMGKNGVRVGDWVEINGVVGEVVEINLFRTIVLETGNWADTGHPTGRKVAFMNSFATAGHYFNFSTGGQWLWDEIELLVPPDQDPYPIADAIQKMAAHETEANAKAAEVEWKQTTHTHHSQSVSATPAIDLRPTKAGVEIHIRYITQAHERYTMRAQLYKAIIGLLRNKPGEQGKPSAS